MMDTTDYKLQNTDYRLYLTTETWQKKRDERLEIDGGICQACLSAPATEVHHLNYYNIGNEDVLTDLVSVCHPCHRKIHNLMTRATAKNPDGSYRYGWSNSLPDIVTRSLKERDLTR